MSNFQTTQILFVEETVISSMYGGKKNFGKNIPKGFLVAHTVKNIQNTGTL